MKLNTQGRYALIALVDLSSRNTLKNVSLSEISERQNISLPYLEQLFLKLRKAGIVKSYRGSYGGYAIAKSPDLLRITEILKAVDLDLDLGSDLKDPIKINHTRGRMVKHYLTTRRCPPRRRPRCGRRESLAAALAKYDIRNICKGTIKAARWARDQCMHVRDVQHL